jgi:putative ABC transport system substrate-binding protein
MSKKFVLCMLGITLASPLQLAKAQQTTKIPRIGWITASSLSANAARRKAFRQGLRELGYIEGKNILIEWRSGEEKRDRVRALAVELVHRKVDVIVTGGAGATRTVKEATSTIPIVMAQDQDPVSNGFVVSLARPGGNITGLSRLAPELSGKQVEILKEIVPRLFHVAVLESSTQPGKAQIVKQIEGAAKTLGVKLHYLDLQDSMDFENAFREATKEHADAALWLVGGNIAMAHRKTITGLAVKSRLPTIYEQRAFAEVGGLISYGVSFPDLDRRAATYVDKILKGTKPTDLPVELPTKFDLVINLKTAKALGLKIPPALLMEASTVIE